MPFWKYPFTTPVELARNLVLNPSVTQAITGWTAVSGFSAGVTRASGAGADGRGGYAQGSASGSTITLNPHVPGNGTNYPVSPGNVRTVSMYVNVSVAGMTASARTRWLNAGGALITQDVGTGVALTPNVWTRVSVTATAPALSVGLDFQVAITGPTAGATLRFDCAMVTSGNTLHPYFDGDYARSGTTYYRWLGTPDASASVAEGPGASDTFTPMVDAITPYGISATTRTVARELMESSEARAAWYPTTARAGQLRIGCTDVPEAMTGMSFFQANGTFHLDHSESYADMTFAVVDGDITFERGEITAVVLVVPFKEVTAT